MVVVDIYAFGANLYNGVRTLKYIFVHGLGQTEKSWDSMVLKLAKNQVLCPNLQSLLYSEEITYEKLYDCFKEYCNGLSEPLNLCGLSLGGILALNYAIDFPAKVNSLVLIGIQYKMPKLLLKIQNLVFRFMPKSLFVGMGFSKSDFINLTNSMTTLDFTSSLAEISCKSLIACGSEDKANKKAAIELSKKLKCSKLVLIENSKHEVNIDNPDGLLEEINRFYDEMT